jgi:hypothetical protein
MQVAGLPLTILLDLHDLFLLSRPERAPHLLLQISHLIRPFLVIWVNYPHHFGRCGTREFGTCPELHQAQHSMLRSMPGHA